VSRRSGLGRGLAALIPPTTEDDEPNEIGDAPVPPTSRDDPRTVEHLPGGSDETPPVGAPRPDPDGGTSEASAPQAGPLPRAGTGHTPPATYQEITPAYIEPNHLQPREVFDPEELEGLAISLKDVGMLQPLVVRPLGDGRYELVAGERRLRAAKLAGLEKVPALVRHTDDANLLKEALVENIHRVQLNPLEEGAAYQQLLQEFGVTQEELAARLGRSRPAISNAIRILQLPPAVQRRVAAGVLSAGHAKALLAVENADLQSRLADRIVAEGLSVRATEELVRMKLLDEPPRRSKSRRTPTAPGLVELQEDLSDALEARVRISMGARKGKLAIDFTSVDDLERIVAVIADGLGSRGRGVAPPSDTGLGGAGITPPDA